MSKNTAMALLALILHLAPPSVSQAPKPAAPASLLNYLTAHPWDASKNGPLVVLQPERVTAKAGEAGLDAFDRKLVKVGHLNAIVPRTMVLIDDSLNQPPNMYDGLPPDAKVMYLLRTLSEDQWRKVSDAGLGIEDLEGEQRLVLQSLLPKPFAWTSFLVGDNGMWGKQQAAGTLGEDERQHVRLKVSRFVNFRVFMDQGKGYSEFGSDRYRGVPGAAFTTRDQDKQSPESAFGLKIRKVAGNRPKPSDLNYSVLTAKVVAPSIASVRDLLRLLGSACRLELIPDLRVGDRSVTLIGGTVEAGDLLKALAECVTGTFRRVGGAYVLTSDLVGLGNRKLRISAWENDIQQELSKREDQWRHEIGGHAGFNLLTFGGGLTAPSGDLLKTIDKADRSDSIKVTSDALSPPLRTLLDQWDHEYPTQPIMKDSVGVSSALHYSFVLPDGTQLQPEGDLGPLSMYLPRSEFHPYKMPAIPVPMAPRAETPFVIAVRAISGDAIASIMTGCVVHGVRRIWLETDDPAVLKKAIKEGAASKVEICLLIRPWTLPRGTDGPDCTLYGDHGAAVAARVAGSISWTGWLERQAPVMPPLMDLLSPTDGAVPARWSELAALAKTPGLVGVALADTQPPGYEPKRAEWKSALGPLEWAIVGHGYSDRQRVAFLRAHEVDPIDLADSGYWTTAELRQPFFIDDELAAIPSIDDDIPTQNPKLGGMFQEWRRYLASRNSAAILQLAYAIGRPLLIDMRPELVNTMPSGTTALSRWHPGEALPLGVGQQTGMFDPGKGGAVMVPVASDPSSPAGLRCAAMVMLMCRPFPDPRHEPGDVTAVFDFTQTPSNLVTQALERWFKLPVK